MNARVLELLKDPELLQADDLKLLDDQIRTTPYVQNIRALHLVGTSRFDSGNYQKELSTTAAYTTDKKILYQLINGKVKNELIPEQDSNSSEEINEISSSLSPAKTEEKMPQKDAAPDKELKADDSNLLRPAENPFTELLPVEVPIPAPVHVEGKLNRILFEGEEDFLEQETPKIDKEATEEAGQLVLAEPDLSAPRIFTEETAPQTALLRKQEITENIENYNAVADSPQAGSPVLNVNEEVIQSEEIVLMEDSVVNFQGTAPFLPDVKLVPGNTTNPPKEATVPTANKHEEEMRRLIEEVERKIKEKKKVQTITERVQPEESHDTEISFTETQEFPVSKNERGSDSVKPVKSFSAEPSPIKVETEHDLKSEPEISQTGKAPVREENHIEKPVPVQKTELPSFWKPMSFSTNVPDALLKKEERPAAKDFVHSTQKPAEVKDKIAEAEHEDLTVGEGKGTEEKEISAVVPELAGGNQPEMDGNTEAEKSNIPQFINTWQSWLKIDRVPTAPVESPQVPKEDKKNATIEKFIETAPKISQLKEENSFTVKEKKGDISHLMTETLANIYTEQKLYAKAIKAFQILTQKHPHKAEYFEEKVKEVKDLRNKI